MSTVNVKGLAELQKMLDSIAPKIEKNIMRGACRAGVKVLQQEAKANVPVESGALRDGLKISTGTKGGRVLASLKAKGPHGFVAHFMEFGTKAHVIAARDGAGLAFGGHVFRAVEHPGIRPKPFMRPAMDARAMDAIVASGEYIKQRLATKEGLDTSHIVIEGDE